MSAAVTKVELVQYLFETLGINKREAKEIVELFFEEIIRALVSGEIVKLPGFGVFTPRNKTSREGRNPKTGEIVVIKERRVATFKAAGSLKANIQAHAKSNIKQKKTTKQT